VWRVESYPRSGREFCTTALIGVEAVRSTAKRDMMALSVSKCSIRTIVCAQVPHGRGMPIADLRHERNQPVGSVRCH
jgi:hypothetical protein